MGQKALKVSLRPVGDATAVGHEAPAEQAIDDEQDTPAYALNPDDVGAYDRDDFSVVDHLANFVSSGLCLPCCTVRCVDWHMQDDNALDKDAAWAYADKAAAADGPVRRLLLRPARGRGRVLLR